MEVSSRDHVTRNTLAIGDENQGVVDRRIDFCLKYRAAMSHGVADCAMHLRDAAQRIGILDAAAIAVRFADLTGLQHATQVLRTLDLSAVGTCLVNSFIECRIRAL